MSSRFLFNKTYLRKFKVYKKNYPTLKFGSYLYGLRTFDPSFRNLKTNPYQNIFSSGSLIFSSLIFYLR
ncbi:hypothetical protein DRO26_00090 [Candidatus Bathyarchaeota archaeon]|nr:MAG: hypothetical protein DRO26_00090 [Candidatus Bathyarchaeota archaeon]